MDTFDFSLENMDFSRHLSDTDSDDHCDDVDDHMDICYAVADRAAHIFTTWMRDPETIGTPDIPFPTLFDLHNEEPEHISIFTLFRSQCDPFRDDLSVFADHYHLLTSRTTLRHLFASRLLPIESKGIEEWIREDSGTWLLVDQQSVVTPGQIKWMFDTIRAGMKTKIDRRALSTAIVGDLAMSDPIRSSCVIQLLIEREYEITAKLHGK